MPVSFRLLALLVLAWSALSPVRAAGVLVAFKTAADGGLARVELDAAGRAGEPAVLFRAPSFRAAAKLRVSADGRFAALDAAAENAPNLALVDLHPSPAKARLLTLGFEPDEMRLWRDRVLIGGKDGWIVSLERETGASLHRWNARDRLRPPGHKPEDLQVLEPEGLLLVTLQKDGKKGRLGSRLVTLRLADLSPVGDLPLPRDHPELHLSDKEAGPSPELIRIDRASNTLLLTLDLYGALAFADLDAALAGAWKNLAAVPTSENGGWGTAFPDRVAVVAHDGRSFAFVFNAAADGGIAVFDLAARRRVGFLPVEAGCEQPVPVNGGRTLATVVSGKIKRPDGAGLAKEEKPGSDLLLIDVALALRGDPAALTRRPLGAPATRIAAIAGNDRQVAVGLAGETPRLLIYDTGTTSELSRIPLPGEAVALSPVP